MFCMFIKCWQVLDMNSSLAVWTWDPYICWSVAGFGLSQTGSVHCW